MLPMPFAALVFSCTPVIPGVGDVLPADGAEGVPANAAIVFEATVHDGSVTAMVVLTSAMGGFSGPAAIGAGDVFVFDPGSDLAPGNWVATITLDSPGGGGTKVVHFAAVSGTDAAAPVFAAGEIDFDVGSYFDPGPVEDCPDPPGVWAVASDWEDATDASPIAYAVRGLLLTQSQVTIGALPDQTLSLEVFAYDAAGNLGAHPVGLLDVKGVPGDEGGGCGCRIQHTGSRGAASSLVLAFLAVVAVVRLRRSSR